METERALIAMSGGVDSSVAAYLMKERGFDCMGVTMKLFANEEIGLEKDKSCCSLSDTEDARAVALRLGIPYYVMNFSGDFEKYVIGRFIEAYENGITPNPCIDCNRFLKFAALYEKGHALGCDYVVTGHYVRRAFDEKSSRYILKKGLDESKDQSYVLWSLTQEQLKHSMFPLGELEKSRVREIAEAQGFVNAKKQDSQDICFVTGSYTDFIRSRTGREYPEGDFVDEEGHVLGRHKGIIHYTIGQRKGFGLSFPQPMYVKKIDTVNNTVVLAKNEALFTRALTASDVNLIALPAITEEIRVKARVRYHHKEQDALVTPLSDGRIRVLFDEPQRAVTKGQSLVLYDGDVVVGGGIISETE
ncbi:MAG: tRNA 2-thiouridine(34) synthase MnmA [Lachnospiraceae bacterium]|nr:tRNA 2-thiouridine(34) synthase MnmA [Lachnospiraceae bacterium]